MQIILREANFENRGRNTSVELHFWAKLYCPFRAFFFIFRIVLPSGSNLINFDGPLTNPRALKVLKMAPSVRSSTRENYVNDIRRTVMFKRTSLPFLNLVNTEA